MSTALKIIVDDFADFHDMRRVQRDTHGIYTLVFDQRWVINIESDPASNIVSIFASPGSVRPNLELGPDTPEMEWVTLTEADLPFGGRVGVHYPSGMVMLDSQADAADLNTVAFRLWLMGFVDQLILWSKQVSPRKRAEGLLQAGPAAKAIADTADTTKPDLKLTSQGSEA
jgi:hypothetical protein